MKVKPPSIKPAILLFISIFICCLSLSANRYETKVIPGAERTDIYLPLLINKRVAVVSNPSSRIENCHLVDSLLSLGINIRKIFSPEHGFRGEADAGEKVMSGIDDATGLTVISLYGKYHKPSGDDLSDVDIVVFDLQDVGARFYTYIYTLHWVMEACAENKVPLILLDRPNPNGFYIDGPVLKPGFASGVGMHPVPVVHGMSIGEYGRMINGEGWLKDGIRCLLKVIPCQNWNHQTRYELPVNPSPNLPNYTSVILYPSLCFFEGTVVSAGRGTDFPFQCFGHPMMEGTSFTYTPRSIIGACKSPKFKGIECKGYDLRKGEQQKILKKRRLNLNYLFTAYNSLQFKNKFFNGFFEKLAGTDELQKQIEMGWSEKRIRNSWKNDLKRFRKMRKKYLIYSDMD